MYLILMGKTGQNDRELVKEQIIFNRDIHKMNFSAFNIYLFYELHGCNFDGFGEGYLK